MTSTLIDLKQLSRLSQLELSNQESQRLAPQFSDTLKAVDQLQSLDTQTVKPTPQVIKLENVWRPDEINSTRQLTQKQALANAPLTHQGYFVVPAVLNK